jgi:hypothetical protein
MKAKDARSNRVMDETEAHLQRCRVDHDLKSHAANGYDWRLELLIDRLPRRFRSTIRWLRQPSSVWIRSPAGVLLTCGGLFGFLPIFGFWMLPLGLALLADDLPPLRSVRSQILNWIERRHPHWLADGSCLKISNLEEALSKMKAPRVEASTRCCLSADVVGSSRRLTEID